MSNVFDELESRIDTAEEINEEIQAEESGSKRIRSTFYVVDVKAVLQNQRELREYLEQNSETLGNVRIVKGNEIFARKKTVYTF